MVNEREKRDSNFMYVMIEFPHIHYEGMEYSVIYFEMVCDYVCVAVCFKLRFCTVAMASFMTHHCCHGIIQDF